MLGFSQSSICNYSIVMKPGTPKRDSVSFSDIISWPLIVWRNLKCWVLHFEPWLIQVCQLYFIEKKIFSISEKFLLYLSEHVPAVQIYQILDRAISDTVPYFLGMRDFDWAPTFLEMCSKKLDKLSIVNLGLTDFLPIESSEQLRKVWKLNQSLNNID